MSDAASRIPAGDGERIGKLQRLDIGRMARESPPPVPWIVDGLAVRGALTIISGREGAGKSLLAMGLAAGVARGETQAGISCCVGRVLIVDAENGEYETHRRVHTLGLPDSVVMYQPDHGGRFDLRADLGELDRLLAKHTPDLLILDSFRSLWGGEENDSGEVAKVLDAVRNLVRQRSTAALLLAHSGKAVGPVGYRGSTAIGASAELGFTLVRERGANDPERRSLTCWKCRPAPMPDTAWFRFVFERGGVLIEPAEPGRGADAPTCRPVVAQLTATIMTAIGGESLTVAEIARLVDRSPKDGSVRNALACLDRDGEMHKTDGRWSKVQRCTPPIDVEPLHPPDAIEEPLTCQSFDGLDADTRCRCESPLPRPSNGALRCARCELPAYGW
jgi:hypothetical protein